MRFTRRVVAAVAVAVMSLGAASGSAEALDTGWGSARIISDGSSSYTTVQSRYDTGWGN